MEDLPAGLRQRFYSVHSTSNHQTYHVAIMRLYLLLACLTLLSLSFATPSNHLLPRRHGDSRPAAARSRGRAIHPNANWEGYARREDSTVHRRVTARKADTKAQGMSSGKLEAASNVSEKTKLGRFTMGRRKGIVADHGKEERRGGFR